MLLINYDKFSTIGPIIAISCHVNNLLTSQMENASHFKIFISLYFIFYYGVYIGLLRNYEKAWDSSKTKFEEE
jgi:hypothetical protein